MVALEVGQAGHLLFARSDDVCVKCDTNVNLGCPTCDEGQYCAFTAQSCTNCASSYCAIAPSSSSSSSSGSGGTNTGAIVGGVVGGLAAIAIATYLVWRLWIRNRRSELDEQWQEDPSFGPSKEATEQDFASRRSARQSTGAQSTHSLASTVLTRASNIIQIAYIPGVTNRAAPSSPDVLVPPVPPIPLAHSGSSMIEDQHFFVPGNLRDSTYSGVSQLTDHQSVAPTYVPRSSVASTIYGKSAVVSSTPAQKGTLLKPSLVSVKSKGSGSEGSTPPVPTVDFQKYDAKPPPSPAFSIGSTFLKNANASTATAVKPQVVRVSSVRSTSAGSGAAAKAEAKSSSSSESTVSDPSGTQSSPESTGKTNGSDIGRHSNAMTIIDDTPIEGSEGPFSDPESPAQKTGVTLTAVPEETSDRNSRSRPKSPSRDRDRSPFADVNSIAD